MDQSILIVDDRNENLVALESLLERPGLTLLKATNGNEALKLLLKNDVALVLMDVQMPGMDGFEVAELMRRNKKTQSVPIIFVTANGDKRQLFRGYEVGAVDYLAKPIERDVLISKVSVFLQLDHQRRELQMQLEKIKQLKLQNEQLLFALSDGVLSVNIEGNINFVNPAVKPLFGLEPDQLIGRSISDFVTDMHTGEPLNWCQSDILSTTKRGQSYRCDERFSVKSGQEVSPAFLSASPVFNSEGAFTGAVITVRLPTDYDRSRVLEELARKSRRSSRKKISVVLRMFDRTTGKNLGRLANISPEGFKLISREDIATDAKFPISMILPEAIAGSNTLSLDCQQVWCSPCDENPGDFKVGFKITSIGENDKKVLAELIERY